MNVLLKGIVGSTAYGLNHEGSDVDYLGVFAAPTQDILGLDWHKSRESLVTKDPDTTLHEAKKFVTLCLSGNPSVSELLWLDAYEQMNDFGLELIGLRRSFLSAERVREAYLGYAQGQFDRMRRRDDHTFSSDTKKRTEKHARHLVRLVEQGYQLYRTGDLVVNLGSDASETRPEKVFELGRMLAMDLDRAEKYMRLAEIRYDRVRHPAVPASPDREAVQQWLIRVRRADWGLA